MAFHTYLQYQTGSSLGFSVTRVADGLYYDFTNATFTATPATLIQTLAEGTGNFVGTYDFVIATTPQATWTDGNYVVSYHNTAASNLVVSRALNTMIGGSDNNTSGGGGGATASEIWSDNNGSDFTIAGSPGLWLKTLYAVFQGMPAGLAGTVSDAAPTVNGFKTSGFNTLYNYPAGTKVEVNFTSPTSALAGYTYAATYTPGANGTQALAFPTPLAVAPANGESIVVMNIP